MNKLIFAGILFLIIMVCIPVLNYRLKKDLTRKEGFSYTDCRNKGFTKEFCVQTPIASWGTGVCLCDDGQVGLQMPGFGGECVCGMALENPVYR